MKGIARRSYSNPPLHGARIVETVLSSPELTSLWFEDIKVMAERIADMRKALVDNLKKVGSPHSWTHITT